MESQEAAKTSTGRGMDEGGWIKRAVAIWDYVDILICVPDVFCTPARWEEEPLPTKLGLPSSLPTSTTLDDQVTMERSRDYGFFYQI